MLTFGNERIIQQGEEWNLDILISQSDTEYIPFIVSSNRQNPMLAITVASTKYEKNERYVTTWWLGLEDLPRFYQTVPEFLGDLDTNNIPLVPPPGDPPLYALYQYTKASERIDPKLGHKKYYYVYFISNGDGGYILKDDYEFRVRMQFRSSETSQWGSQNYMYQITLVDTINMEDCIQAAKYRHPNLQWPNLPITGNEAMFYTFIKDRIPDWFQPDIDIPDMSMEYPGELPGRIDIPQIILPPTKLQVNNNLRKII